MGICVSLATASPPEAEVDMAWKKQLIHAPLDLWNNGVKALYLHLFQRGMVDCHGLLWPFVPLKESFMFILQISIDSIDISQILDSGIETFRIAHDSAPI